MYKLLVLFAVIAMLASTSRAFMQTARRGFTSSALRMGLHDHSLETLSGENKKLSDYKGKVVLLENVATL